MMYTKIDRFKDKKMKYLNNEISNLIFFKKTNCKMARRKSC